MSQASLVTLSTIFPWRPGVVLRSNAAFASASEKTLSISGRRFPASTSAAERDELLLVWFDDEVDGGDPA